MWEVLSFLRHAGFYRRFIRDFSKIALPLSSLLQKDVSFIFIDSCKEAFKELKRRLTTSLIMQPPNWELPFKLICDASDYALGAVLSQRLKNCLYKSRCIEFLQKKLVAKPRLLRWMLLLQEFDIDIKDRSDSVPWFVDIVNYLVTSVVPPHASRSQEAILDHREQLGGYWTADFIGPSSLGKQSGMHFMSPFPVSSGYSYILLVDYVSRWVKAQVTKTNDSKVVSDFLWTNIFCRFGVPKTVTSDQGSPFCNRTIATLFQKYKVTHRIATLYHPQTNAIWAQRIAYRVPLGKLRSRWDGPFVITNVFPHGAVEIKDEVTGRVFKVNGQQLKLFQESKPMQKAQNTVDVSLVEPILMEEVST
ncbi:uncharacterized protein LOC113857818 [Abrus precatorius]|uniref:Uncharacterized protein LOC113857818 n=1 Tax=Abrus precatorius TaxID=3816 RepID=A0A8B8KPR1_ABRPR|nr:uncharacterized protein LOC113857818 [Abrus precatorius]